MPSIIRATTTSGLQVAPDNSGSLQLQTNGTTTAVTIDTSQNVGIGTTSPSSYGKLAVSGVLGISNTGASGYAWRYFRNTSTPTAYCYDDGTNVQLTVQTAGALQLATNDTERMRIDSSGYASGTVNGLGRGIYQAQQYYRLNSAVVGANVTTAQNTFGVGVTLIGSTQYEFEMVVVLNKTAGTTSHTISTLFGGTATLNNILCVIFSSGSDGAPPTAIVGANNIVTNTAAATVISGAITSASRTATHIIKGTVSINAGGTFIPQYQLSAAPGGAYTTQIGSYFKIAPLAASGSNVSIGSWA